MSLVCNKYLISHTTIMEYNTARTVPPADMGSFMPSAMHQYPIAARFPQYEVEFETKGPYDCIWYTYELLLANPNFLDQSKESSRTRVFAEELPLFMQLQKDTLHEKSDDKLDYICVPVLHATKQGHRIYVDFKRPNTVIDGGGIYPGATKLDDTHVRLSRDSPVGVGDAIFLDTAIYHVKAITHEENATIIELDEVITTFTHCGWFIEDPSKTNDSIIRTILYNHTLMSKPAPTQILGVGGLFQEEQFMLFFNRARVTCVIDDRTHLLVDRHFYDQPWLGGEPIYLCLVRPTDDEFITYCRYYPVSKNMDRYEVVYRQRPMEWSVYLGQYLGNKVDQDRPRCTIFVEPGVLPPSI